MKENIEVMCLFFPVKVSPKPKKKYTVSDRVIDEGKVHIILGSAIKQLSYIKEASPTPNVTRWSVSQMASYVNNYIWTNYNRHLHKIKYMLKGKPDTLVK